MATERKFVRENIRRVLLKEYLMKETERAGFGGLEVQRTPMGTRVVLYCERPGFVIGRKGGAIKDLTAAIEQKFKFDNPQIEVQEVKNPALNAQIMAKKLAIALERGWQYRRAGHSTVRRIMDAGARGCQVIISGKLAGERHRTEKFREGMIKYCGDSALKFMEKGFAIAKLKPGVMGATVWIMRPDAKLPDEIRVKDPSEVFPQSAPKVGEASQSQTPAATQTTEAQPVAQQAVVSSSAKSSTTKSEFTFKTEKIRVKSKLKRQIQSELKSLRETEVPPMEEDLIDVETGEPEEEEEKKEGRVEKEEKGKEVN